MSDGTVCRYFFLLPSLVLSVRNLLLLYNIIAPFLWFLWSHDRDQRPPHELFIMPRIHLCPLQAIQHQHMVITKFQGNHKGIKSHIFPGEQIFNIHRILKAAL